MQARFGVVKVLQASGKLEDARRETGEILEVALSTADPGLQALAWEVSASLAIACKDGKGGEKSIRNGLAILENFGIPMAAWRLDQTAWEFYQMLKNETEAESHRKRGEICILKIANSFASMNRFGRRFSPPLRFAGSWAKKLRSKPRANTN